MEKWTIETVFQDTWGDDLKFMVINLKWEQPLWYIYFSSLNQLHRYRIDRKFILIRIIILINQFVEVKEDQRARDIHKCLMIQF